MSAGGENGKSLIAYHISNGEIIWQGGNSPAGYSSAIAANFSTVNISEMENIVKWASDVGIKRCNFSLTYKTSGNTVFEKRLKNNPNLICNSNNWEVFWEAQLRAEELAKKLDIHLDFIVPFHGGFTKNPTDWNHASGNKVRNQY